jgi:hypothetical protein
MHAVTVCKEQRRDIVLQWLQQQVAPKRFTYPTSSKPKEGAIEDNLVHEYKSSLTPSHQNCSQTAFTSAPKSVTSTAIHKRKKTNLLCSSLAPRVSVRKSQPSLQPLQKSILSPSSQSFSSRFITLPNKNIRPVLRPKKPIHPLQLNFDHMDRTNSSTHNFRPRVHKDDDIFVSNEMVFRNRTFQKRDYSCDDDCETTKEQEQRSADRALKLFNEAYCFLIKDYKMKKNFAMREMLRCQRLLESRRKALNLPDDGTKT